jgi:hypothetical protein
VSRVSRFTRALRFRFVRFHPCKALLYLLEYVATSRVEVQCTCSMNDVLARRVTD